MSAEERRRREEAAREGRCRHHTRRLAALVNQLADTSVVRPVTEPASKTPDLVTEWEADLLRAIDEVQDRIRDESARVVVQRLNAARQAVDVSGVSLGGPAPTRTPTAPAPDTERQRLSADVDKIVEVVANLRDAALRDRLTDLAVRVLQTTSPAQARGDLLTLKTKVTNALRVQDCQDVAASVVLQIAEIDSPAADQLRARAASVTSTDEVSALRQDVTALVEAAAAAADAQFVQQALTDVLDELGFDVGEGFELSQFGAVAVADHDDHPGYGIRFQVNPGNQTVLTRVVADGASTAEADTQAEAQTCAKVRAVTAGLQQRGVAAQLSSERQPGERPVDRREAASAAAKKARSRRRRTGTTQERSR